MSRLAGFEHRHFRACLSFQPVDASIANLLDRAYNHAVFQALETGRLHVYVPGIIDHDAAHAGLVGTWDFVAVNHYFRHLAGLRYIRRSRSLVGFDANCAKNDMGWDLTPHSLYDALQLVAKYGKPIYVTENGSCESAVPDDRRRMFLLQSLYALSEAVRHGVDVRAYLYWSLLDNFEWAHGFGPRFGLYRVDYETQERTLTRAGELYRRVARAHHPDLHPAKKTTIR